MVLRQRGGQYVLTPDMGEAMNPAGGYAPAQADLIAQVVGSGPVTLVAHSGAGPLLPTIAERLSRRSVSVTGSVFADAGLPHPGRSRLEMLPPPAAKHLESLAMAGWIPPWPSWWSSDELREMVSDPKQRDTLRAECPRLPWGLFTEPLPDADERALGACRYLRLSKSYDGSADTAQRARWTVRRLPAHHLAPLTDPVQIADALEVIVAPRTTRDNSGTLSWLR